MDTAKVSNITISKSMSATGPPASLHKNEYPCHLQNPTRKDYPSMLPAMNPSGVAGISPRTKILTSENSYSAIHPMVFPIIYYHTRPQGFLF